MLSRSNVLSGRADTPAVVDDSGVAAVGFCCELIIRYVHSAARNVYMRARAGMHACVCVCVCMCVFVYMGGWVDGCARACVYMPVCVGALRVLTQPVPRLICCNACKPRYVRRCMCTHDGALESSLLQLRCD